MLEFTKYIQRYSSVTPRTYVFEFPFYTIINKFRQKFCLGHRPEDLDHIITIERRALERHQAHMNRLERFPLDKAEYYLKLKEAHGVNSVRGIAKITGEDWSYIAKILRTLSLPEPIKDFLKNNKHDPAILRFFHLRKLLNIIRQGEERLQLARFRELMEEFEERER